MLNNQRGSIELYAIIGVLAITIGAGMVYTYQHAIIRAERAEADNTTLRTANGELLADNMGLRAIAERNNKLLAERQTQRNTADNIERAVNAKLSEIYRTSEPARTWRDTPVPADVLRGMRAEPTGGITKDGKGIPAGKPVPADPDR
jgi:hypothetical protein